MQEGITPIKVLQVSKE